MFLSYVALGIYYLNLYASSVEGDRLWMKFKADFNKTYSNNEEIKRKKIFFENLGTLRFHNLKHAFGASSFLMGINEKSDASFNEYLNLQSPDRNPPPKDEYSQQLLDPEIKYSHFYIRGDIPEKFDWRDHISMTSVKNQKKCGACYAFAVLGAIESLIFKQTGKVVDLSAQEIIDCGKGYRSFGCNGGNDIGVLYYIKENGISYEKDYPYTARQGSCRRNETHDRFYLNFTKIMTASLESSEEEEELTRQLLLYGPTIVSMDHLHESFMRYSSGIYYESDCSQKKDDSSHTVLLVGYGSEEGNDYWIVKNSFGRSWGEDGYFRIARNKNNHCLIASFSTSIDTAEKVFNNYNEQNA